MSTEKSTTVKDFAMDALKVALVIVTSWQLFANDIHGYIDTQLEELEKNVVRKVNNTTSGQMLQVVDSIGDRMQAYQDTNAARFINLEELIGVRPSNRTIITPPDTVAIKRLQLEMRQVHEGIELILDGQADAAGKRRPRRAHNAYPQ